MNTRAIENTYRFRLFDLLRQDQAAEHAAHRITQITLNRGLSDTEISMLRDTVISSLYHPVSTAPR